MARHAAQRGRALPQARVVVPGHGQWGGTELLTHTAELLREAARRKPPTALRDAGP
ncbi:hypothetical protein MUN84_09710 [Hymenobacter sp. 5516J-16]|uniref:hypothetical protein n=1 Tax=Hymenobacter sp. 5516J-16 TaxID=2932253 RepID=UPI001FD4FCE5|nr:hypothetical protein [Hymenobacter sp. 5516J-16]UOQ78777.1 hypothetical protein MUN84_09710 [Hymenobacter sp. 5516J-16]